MVRSPLCWCATDAKRFEASRVTCRMDDGPAAISPGRFRRTTEQQVRVRERERPRDRMLRWRTSVGEGRERGQPPVLCLFWFFLKVPTFYSKTDVILSQNSTKQTDAHINTCRSPEGCAFYTHGAEMTPQPTP